MDIWIPLPFFPSIIIRRIMLDFQSYWMEDMRLNTHAPSHWLPVPHHNRKVLPDQFPSDQERLPAALLLSLHQVLNRVCHVFLPRHYRLQLLSELLPLPVLFGFRILCYGAFYRCLCSIVRSLFVCVRTSRIGSIHI